jgi:8-amino-7-oxononanoate synthase
MTCVARRFGAGSGAAALISGYTTAHAQAEQAIARWKGYEAAVLLPSGYQANLAAVQTIAALAVNDGKTARFLVDKLAHASLLDAVLATKGPMRIFPHNQLGKLRRLLSDAPADQLQVVLTESIFSMDGDACDLAGLAELRRQYGCILMVDEGHASGVYGPNGSGYAAEIGLGQVADVSIATLSKAVGCVGGAVCASVGFCEALANFGRAYIYSTSIPAPVAAAVGCAIEVMRREPDRQIRLRANARRVRAALGLGAGAHTPADSPIIPVILGDEHGAMEAAARLEEAGLLAVAVRPPTVPRGTSRLRITLSSEHSAAEVDRLVEAVGRVIAGVGSARK